MTWGDDALVVLPATLPLDELKRRLALADAAVIMKIGRNFARAKEALVASGHGGARHLCRARDDGGRGRDAALREAGRVRALFLARFSRRAGGGGRERARHDRRARARARPNG